LVDKNLSNVQFDIGIQTVLGKKRKKRKRKKEGQYKEVKISCIRILAPYF
jgi:hypothetical protein